jgi:aspartate/methionine/tyrosine aminotransferase
MKDIAVAKRLNSIREYYFSMKLREIEQLNQGEVKVINLGIGSPDLPPHPAVVSALHEAALRPDTHAYQSYKGAEALRKAIAGWYERSYGVRLNPATEILPLIGSKEGIMHLSMTFLDPGDEVLVPNPGYPTYRSATELAGGTCVSYELKQETGWRPDLDRLAQGDLSRVKLMWVNYPHMPTGATADEGLLRELVAFGRAHGILLCHDNPYSFILNDDPRSLLAVEGAMETAVELNSLSKSHNMAGWRVGMLAGKEAFIREVLRFKSNMDSGMFLPLQLAAATALGLDDAWYRELNGVYGRRRRKVYELLDRLGCRYEKDRPGMFVWARIPEGYADGFALSDEVLYKARVFITPGGIFGTGGNGYVRVSLCRSEGVFEEALDRLATHLPAGGSKPATSQSHGK